MKRLLRLIDAAIDVAVEVVLYAVACRMVALFDDECDPGSLDDIALYHGPEAAAYIAQVRALPEVES